MELKGLLRDALQKGKGERGTAAKNQSANHAQIYARALKQFCNVVLGVFITAHKTFCVALPNKGLVMSIVCAMEIL